VDVADAEDDVIKVAAGTYTGVSARQGVTQAVYISKTVTIRGGYTTTNWSLSDPATNRAILDAQDGGRVLLITGTIAPTIEGLYLTRGSVAGSGGGIAAIGSASPTITGTYVYSNSAINGGGICLYGASGMIRNSEITTNTTSGDGGGIHLNASGASVIDNLIAWNEAADGGGLYLLNSDTATIRGNRIRGNTSTGFDGGGGVLLWNSAATVSSNTIADNAAVAGAGLASVSDDPTLDANLVTGNTASSWGGGIFLRVSDALMRNNLVARNGAGDVGSGIFIRASAPRAFHTTIVRNVHPTGDGTAIYVAEEMGTYSRAFFTDTILVSQTVGISVATGNSANLNATLWGTTTSGSNGTDWIANGSLLTGTTNLWEAPGFLCVNCGGYHLASSSAAIDAGVNAGVTVDVDGGSRPSGSGYEIGYDEYHSPTVVDLFSFKVTWADGKVDVAWETGFKLNTLGFNVWRSTAPDGTYTQVNDKLIPVSAWSHDYARYAFADEGVAKGMDYYYKLEEVEIGGARNWHGPVAAGDPRVEFKVYLPLIFW